MAHETSTKALHWRRRWGYLVVAILLVFAGLIGLGFSKVHPVVQMYMTTDSARPGIVRFVLGFASLSSPLSVVTAIHCNGVTFQRGYPEHDYYTGLGWYADVPAIPVGDSYHCTISGPLSTQRLTIPMRAATPLTIVAPTSDTALTRTTPFDVVFDCVAGTPFASAYDGSGKVAPYDTIGCGAQGEAHFDPVIREQFAAGVGKIIVRAEQSISLSSTDTDWQMASVLYVTSASLAVQWQ